MFSPVSFPNSSYLSAVVIYSDVEYLFLVGGFAESAMLQSELRKEFGQKIKIVIPQEASLAILKGIADSIILCHFCVCRSLLIIYVSVGVLRQKVSVGRQCLGVWMKCPR